MVEPVLAVGGGEHGCLRRRGAGRDDPGRVTDSDDDGGNGLESGLSLLLR